MPKGTMHFYCQKPSKPDKIGIICKESDLLSRLNLLPFSYRAQLCNYFATDFDVPKCRKKKRSKFLQDLISNLHFLSSGAPGSTRRGFARHLCPKFRNHCVATLFATICNLCNLCNYLQLVQPAQLCSLCNAAEATALPDQADGGWFCLCDLLVSYFFVIATFWYRAHPGSFSPNYPISPPVFFVFASYLYSECVSQR